MAQGSDTQVIGFIGVGLMGHGMASNILKGGYALQVIGHRNRGPVDDLLGRGATEADSPKALAEACDIIHLCLPNSSVVKATLRGPDGILAGAKPGLIVIDTSTADPTSTEALSAELQAVGASMVDAPLGRTPKEAETGDLDAMVGASDADFDRVTPVIDCWAGSVTRIGPVGSAHKMKLIMNFIGTGYAAIYSEALSLGAMSGVPPQVIRQVIGGSRMGCGFFDTFMSYAVGRDPEAHKFSIENAAKDIRYGNRLADAAGTVNVMGAAIRQYFTYAETNGGAQDYMPMLSDHVARLNGLDLGAEVAKSET